MLETPVGSSTEVVEPKTRQRIADTGQTESVFATTTEAWIEADMGQSNG